MRHWPYFLGSAALIALIGILSEVGWFSRATAEYLEGPIWLCLFLVMAKEFQRLKLTSRFLHAVFLCFSVCFLAEILIRLPIAHVFSDWNYVEPIIDAGWAITCIFVLRGLCVSALQAKQSEQLWRSMFDAAKDCVFVKDTELRYKQVNKSMATLFGGKESLLGHTDSAVMGLGSEQSAKEDEQVLAGANVDTEATIQVHGQPHTFHVIKVPIHDENDQVVGLTGIARDITKRREVEAQLRLTQFSLDHAADLVLWVNIEGDVVYANEASRALMGASLLQLGITAIDQGLSDADSWSRYWERTERAEHLQHETEFCIHLKATVPVEVSAYRFRQGEHDLLCIIARDISIRKRLQAENQQRLAHLSHLSRIQTAGEMVAGLAHELNQPLATATNYSYTISEMLPERAADLDDATLKAIKERMDVVSRESLRAGEIIRRLRSLINKRSNPRVRTEISDLIDTTLDLFDSQWAGKNPVVRDHASVPLYVNVDAIQIQQIFLNLLTNARDSLREKGGSPVLRVATRQEGSRVVVSFADNGMGIVGDPEELFKPYISNKRDGMGLGLAISRTIAQAHDGDLTAKNLPSGGAVFELMLPDAADATDRVEPDRSRDSAATR